MIRCRLPGRTADSLPLYKNGSSVINYTYNADGVRIGKSGSRAGTFIVSGTQILREINSVATIDYLYDENGSPIGLTYKGKTYYYRKNLQGDIINITDSTGAKVVTYTYNAWGKIMSMTGNMELAVNNPFRYRGYYYDVESGLYYLNSRYYDPQTGRFINADSLLGTDGFASYYNLFTYCGNNPVILIDKDGNWSVTCYTFTKNQADSLIKYINKYVKNDLSPKETLASGGGAIFGALAGLISGPWGLAVGGIITITSAATPKYSSELIDFADVLGDATEICNKKNNRKIKISVLFGSHNNQIKIEVIETTKIKIKMRNYWYYYTCSKVIWKRNREYYYNGFNQTIYQFSQNKSVKSYSYYVKTGFKFF